MNTGGWKERKTARGGSFRRQFSNLRAESVFILILSLISAIFVNFLPLHGTLQRMINCITKQFWNTIVLTWSLRESSQICSTDHTD